MIDERKKTQNTCIKREMEIAKGIYRKYINVECLKKRQHKKNTDDADEEEKAVNSTREEKEEKIKIRDTNFAMK